MKERKDLGKIILTIIGLSIFAFLFFRTDNYREYGIAMSFVIVMLFPPAIFLSKTIWRKKIKYETKELNPYLCPECSRSGKKIGKDLYGCVC